MANFIPGLQVTAQFYHEVVRPILEQRFPGLKYAAGRLGRGSDVLGFDTPQSMDHDWGPSRFEVFLEDTTWARYAPEIEAVLAETLPHEFRGLPTDFSTPEVDGGTIKFVREGPVGHRITVTTVRRFFESYIGLYPANDLTAVEWLLIPSQKLCTLASGRVFHDDLTELSQARDRLAWYPPDLWLYLMACQWRKIDQEEPFMARCGDVGDELGSRLVAARLIDEMMRLCFLMERQYWPYAKWFGTAFARLRCASTLTPIFQSVLNSQDWRTREKHLSAAYLHLANMHNDLALTPYLEPKIESFHNRPYQVPHSNRFVEALLAQISAKVIQELPEHLGSVAQYANSTDVLDRVNRCRELQVLYT